MLYVHPSLPSVSHGHLNFSSYAVINVQGKKRQLIVQRLQDKLKKETDSVRRAEEAKKEKQIANRKEEELQLKDSIQHKVSSPLPTA
jgi:plasmid replication initiation protein